MQISTVKRPLIKPVATRPAAATATDKPKAIIGKTDPNAKIKRLPTKVEGPSTDITRSSFLFWGERKIGKTLTAAKFPKCLLILFEPGGEGATAFKQPVANWKQFRDVVDLLEASEDFQTVCIDTADIAYSNCLEYICKSRGITYPRDNNFGDDWSAIKLEYTGAMDRIIATGRGIIFTSHAEKREFTSVSTGVVNKLVPSFSSAPSKYVLGLVSNIVYFGYYAGGRYMTIEGSEDLEAGTRMESNFWVRGKVGEERVHSIPMGKSSQEAYNNLLKAFRNEQAERGEPEGITVLSNTPVPRKKRGAG